MGINKVEIDLELPGLVAEHWRDASGSDLRDAVEPMIKAICGDLVVQFFAGAEERGRRVEIRIPLSDLLSALPELYKTRNAALDKNARSAADAVKDTVIEFAERKLGARSLDAAAMQEGEYEPDWDLLTSLEEELRKGVAAALDGNWKD